MESPSRNSVILTTVGTLAIIVTAALYIWGVTYKPAYAGTRFADAAAQTTKLPSGMKHVTIHLNIVVEVGKGPHADWLGYQTPQGDPGTVFHLPAHALVTVIVHNFDSATALRNPFFTQVRGTVGGIEYVNGKVVKVMNPDLTSHTFTVPKFGVSVPMEGVPDNAKPTQYQTMKFSFHTPGPGVYRWQCIVPCGSGLYGNGGPMQQVGYMDGMFYVS